MSSRHLKPVIAISSHYSNRQIYAVSHNGQVEYLAESLQACYSWVALRLDIPAKTITHMQAMEAGYRIKNERRSKDNE